MPPIIIIGSPPPIIFGLGHITAGGGMGGPRGGACGGGGNDMTARCFRLPSQVLLMLRRSLSRGWPNQQLACRA
jgi:hypothetical protein